LIEAALTPIGVIGGIRGVFFFNIGGGWFNNQPSAAASTCPAPCPPSSFRAAITSSASPSSTSRRTRPASSCSTLNGAPIPIYGDPISVSGFRCRTAVHPTGLARNIRSRVPIHFDWSWRTLFNKQWEDVVFASDGGSSKFRKPRFAVWIGYDF